MRIEVLNNTRGILSIYNGDKYVIYSQYYGVVAESTKIERSDESVTIDFNICEWYGYWALKPIITRGIKKQETLYIDKKVTINYHEQKGQQEHLNKYLKFDLLNY